MIQPTGNLYHYSNGESGQTYEEWKKILQKDFKNPIGCYLLIDDKITNQKVGA